MVVVVRAKQNKQTNKKHKERGGERRGQEVVDIFVHMLFAFFCFLFLMMNRGITRGGGWGKTREDVGCVFKQGAAPHNTEAEVCLCSLSLSPSPSLCDACACMLLVPSARSAFRNQDTCHCGERKQRQFKQVCVVTWSFGCAKHEGQAAAGLQAGQGCSLPSKTRLAFVDVVVEHALCVRECALCVNVQEKRKQEW